MPNHNLRSYFLALSLLGALALSAMVFLPFLKPLVLAAVFAVLLQGLHNRITCLIGGWPSVAALLTVIVSVVLLLLPLSLGGVLIGNEAHNLYISIQDAGGRNAISDMLLQASETYGQVIPGFGEFAQNASADINIYTNEILQWTAGHAGAIFSGISQLLLSSFIFFIALYYLLRDGKNVRKILIELSPMNNKEDRGVFDRLELAINSTIKGSLVIALIQGILSTIGFFVFGVPNAILWGTLAAFAALIPGIGTSLVLIPAIGFLFFTGATVPAIGLLSWGTLAVGLIDNLLGPKLIGKGMKVHPLLVLLAVLGGLAYFGPAGIFLGPLSLSLLFALLSIYVDNSRIHLGS